MTWLVQTIEFLVQLKSSSKHLYFGFGNRSAVFVLARQEYPHEKKYSARNAYVNCTTRLLSSVDLVPHSISRSL